MTRLSEDDIARIRDEQTNGESTDWWGNVRDLLEHVSAVKAERDELIKLNHGWQKADEKSGLKILKLKDERDLWQERFNSVVNRGELENKELREMRGKYIAERDALKALAERYREALEWYATCDYANTCGGEGHIALDRGSRAQKLLKALANKPEGT